MGQVQQLRLLDLPQHVVGAVALVRLRVEEGVDGRQTVVEHIQDRHHLQRAQAIGGRLAEFHQARIDAALQQELGVLVDAVVVHAAAHMAHRLVAQIKLIVLGHEAQPQHPRLEMLMRLQRALLTA